MIPTCKTITDTDSD